MFRKPFFYLFLINGFFTERQNPSEKTVFLYCITPISGCQYPNLKFLNIFLPTYRLLHCLCQLISAHCLFVDVSLCILQSIRQSMRRIFATSTTKPSIQAVRGTVKQLQARYFCVESLNTTSLSTRRVVFSPVRISFIRAPTAILPRVS